MLHELMTAHHEDIVTRTHAKRAAWPSAPKRSGELDDSIPLFLLQVRAALRFPAESPPPMLCETAASHGRGLWRDGFTVSQVVHCYGDICQAVTELAYELSAPLPTADFRIFNRCLDDAIASAVTEYARQTDEKVARENSKNLGLLAHEFKNHLAPAMLAFSTLQDGIVGLEGGTSGLLNRSLYRLQNVVERCLAEVRANAGLVQRERLPLAALLQSAAVGAAIDASSRGVSFVLTPPDSGAEVEADRQLLLGAIQNILQNALEFTPRSGHVALGAREADGQILIEVQDECGGLLDKQAHRLLVAFEQHPDDRTHLGLGLRISNANVRAIGGRLHVRDMPGKGCVFSLALPKPAPG